MEYRKIRASKRRKDDVKKAVRKQHIARAVYAGDVPYYDNLHQYSKNKIHCSCWLCRFHGPSASDARKMEDGKSQLLDYMEGEFVYG